VEKSFKNKTLTYIISDDSHILFSEAWLVGTTVVQISTLPSIVTEDTHILEFIN
jgi:hypothetical protein